MSRSIGFLVACLVALGTSACSWPPITELPIGTFDIDPDDIPTELETDSMTVTISGDTISFNYTTHDGEDVAVEYLVVEDVE